MAKSILWLLMSWQWHMTKHLQTQWWQLNIYIYIYIYIQPEQHCQSENHQQTVTTLWAKWGFWNKIYWGNSFRITQIIASVKAACCSLVITLDNTSQKLVYRWLSARQQYLQCICNRDTTLQSCTNHKFLYRIWCKFSGVLQNNTCLTCQVDRQIL